MTATFRVLDVKSTALQEFFLQVLAETASPGWVKLRELAPCFPLGRHAPHHAPHLDETAGTLRSRKWSRSGEAVTARNAPSLDFAALTR